MTTNALLITSTLLCTIVNVIPIVMKYVTTWMSPEKKIEQKIKAELLELEQEMSVISMVDEFSKYTKMQRRHTKLKEDHKAQLEARLSSRTKIHLFLTYSLKVFNGVFMIILLMLYRDQPVIVLPKGILWPLDGICSWPGIHQDSISLVVWTGIISLTMPHLFRMVN